MQRNLINITKEVEKVMTILARSNNGVCPNCSNFDTTTDHSSGSSNDDSGDSDSDGDEDKPSGQSKQSKPERTKSSTSITSPNCGGRTRQTARGTAASSEKSNRERNALIIAMLSTEERKNFYEQLSKWVKKQLAPCDDSVPVDVVAVLLDQAHNPLLEELLDEASLGLLVWKCV